MLNKIYNEECISGMKKLPDNSVDLIVTSPGTTTSVAKKLGRSYIGFDITKDYCDLAEKRLEND